MPVGLSNVLAVAGGGTSSLALVASPSQVCRSRVVQPGEDYVLIAPLSVGHAARLQWYHDGVLVRLGSTLWLTNVQPADLGQYVAASQFQFGRVTNAVIGNNIRQVKTREFDRRRGAALTAPWCSGRWRAPVRAVTSQLVANAPTASLWCHIVGTR